MCACLSTSLIYVYFITVYVHIYIAEVESVLSTYFNRQKLVKLSHKIRQKTVVASLICVPPLKMCVHVCVCASIMINSNNLTLITPI